MLGPELAAMLLRHFRIFHDQGLGRIDPEMLGRLRERYAPFDHEGAREILAFLDGYWTVTREMMAEDA